MERRTHVEDFLLIHFVDRKVTECKYSNRVWEWRIYYYNVAVYFRQL